jgi:hypothetical protein
MTDGGNDEQVQEPPRKTPAKVYLSDHEIPGDVVVASVSLRDREIVTDDLAVGMGPAHPDNVRRTLAVRLVWFLVGIVVVSFVMFGLTMHFTWDSRDLFALVQVFFTSILSLVSSVIGFYFGSEYVSRKAESGR